MQSIDSGAKAAEGPTIKILLVEDNPGDAAQVIGALAEYPTARYDVRTVTRIADALAALEDEEPDAVLLDLTLPDATGLQGFAKLYAAASSVPLIVLTGNTDETTALKAVREGAQGYLIKSEIYPLLLTRAIHHGIERKGTAQAHEAVEEQLRETVETRMRQSQMEAIGQLAGGIAHDFNNLLTAITGHAQEALAEIPPTGSLRENLDAIVEAADRAAKLTRQILAFSRKQVMHAETVNLNSIILDSSKLLRRLIGEQIQFITVLDRELGAVRADPGQLEQVIMNLAINARDAMRTGGMLRLETRNVTLDSGLAREFGNAVPPGEYVALMVTDTGLGIPPEIQAKIFEPYFTTKPLGQGTGLGLATVYGVVQQSAGYIWVYSEPGEGTTFKVYLPRVAAEQDSAKVTSPATRAAPGWQTVLLVEDDLYVRRLATRVLERHGYRVLVATNGPEALQLAEAEPGPIHLLFTDVVMPGMGGRELAERFAEKRPESRVLFTSGYTEDEVIRRGHASKGIQFLEKPFSPAMLAQKVAQVLAASPSA